MPFYQDKPPDFRMEYPDPDVQPVVDALNRMKQFLYRTITGDNRTIFVRPAFDKLIISAGGPNLGEGPILADFLVCEEFDDYLKVIPYFHKGDVVSLHDETLGTEDNPTDAQSATMLQVEKDADDIANKAAQLAEDAAAIADAAADYGDPIAAEEAQQAADEAAEEAEETAEEAEEDPEFKVGFVYVAKARLLQRTPFDGKTVLLRGLNVTYNYSDSEKGARTATGSGITENQVITPPYFKGDIITARGSVSTGYVVKEEDLPEDGEEDGEEVPKPPPYLIRWEDMNTGGRQWAVRA